MLPARKNIRLDNYDYSRNGEYFITLCTKDKMCICWDNNDKYQPLPQENTPQTVGEAFRKTGFPVWQKSFYDRIIRNEIEYRAFAEYIETNPINWENDELFSK